MIAVLISVLIGIYIGYFLSTKFSLNHLGNLSVIRFFISVTPNPKFLSDVAAFQAVILAFLLPLSIEIISRLSERYKSEVVSSLFKNRWENILFPYVLIFNIILAVVMRFFVDDNFNNGLPLFLAWLVLLVFLFNAYLTFRVVAITKSMISDTKILLGLLFKKVEDYLE